MTVIPSASTQIAELSTVKLAMYAQAVQVCECSFWGVSNSPCPDEQGCRDIWTKTQRDQIAYYLAESQEEIEREIRYYIGQKWTVSERHPYTRPIQTNWGKVIAGGSKTESDISAGAVVNHASDPAIVGPIVTTVTDEDEIKVFHPGTDLEIDPSLITISGGSVTIQIPRCRMVDPDLADNPDNGLDYTVIANFSSTVDVKRVYNDTTTPATLVRITCRSNCADTQSDICSYVRFSQIGSVDIPYNTSSVGLCGCVPNFVDLNYYSGMDMTHQARDTIIRLAHSKMPVNPCNCSPVNEYWKRDRKIPDTITRERANNPFGLSNGAWIAWQWTKRMALKRGATL